MFPEIGLAWENGMTRILQLASVLAMSLLCACAPELDPENTLYMDLETGRVVIALRPDLAPVHVARIKKLTRDGFYNGLKFHRVIDGFMAQTGDPTGTGRGGSGVKLKAELSDEPFKRGSVGMARKRDPDSGDSQFFICVDSAGALDGKYTLLGKVVKGMKLVDDIKKGTWERGGLVDNPDVIVRMRVAADVEPVDKSANY